MDTMAEPAPKKLRVERSFDVKAILSDDYTQDVPLATVYIARLHRKQQISPVMQELCKLLPLPMSLQHLKRVNQDKLVICQKDDCKEATIEDYLRQTELSPEVIGWLSVETSEIQVPAQPPKLRWQYDRVHKIWPCKFHPDKYIESLYSGTNFTEEERQFHSKIGKVLLTLSDKSRQKPTAICLDPRTNSIVAVACSKTEHSPVMHAPMVLIDYVARSQNSGAWNKRFEGEEFLESPDDGGDKEVSLAGITKYFHETIRSEEGMESIRFGAERLRSKGGKIVDPSEVEGEDNLAKYGPYLGTGYYVYLSDEPCLMCSMALVHSRVKRIFFIRPSTDGALSTKFKLHTVKELNHHYEVFHMATDDEGR